MPSVLSDEEKDTVKRFVPKQSNKIQAVAVARLYVAYPNRSKWTYSGLQGAVVLANDLVGNTFWLKMVDVSVRTGLQRCSTSRLLTFVIYCYRIRIAALSGIRKSSIPGTTTKTAPSSTRLRSRSAWPA